MKLFFRELSADSEKTPLVMMHGLFGSSSNLQPIGKSLSALRPVILTDLRNHGRSPHDKAISYQAMAEDIIELLDALQVGQVDLLGHSMGGKVAMWLALNYPERVNHLIVADIAPVRYINRFADIISAMLSLDLHKVKNREDADRKLSAYLASDSLRAYLLQNLLRTEDQWQWRINLPVLAKGIEVIMDFPAMSKEYPKPALFLKGEYSDYLTEDVDADLFAYFPLAEITTIKQAGHWLYAEQPEQFIAAVRDFCCH